MHPRPRELVPGARARRSHPVARQLPRKRGAAGDHRFPRPAQGQSHRPSLHSCAALASPTRLDRALDERRGGMKADGESPVVSRVREAMDAKHASAPRERRSRSMWQPTAAWRSRARSRWSRRSGVLRGHPQPIDDSDHASHATVEREKGPIRGKPERRFSFHHWRDLQLRERQGNRVHSGKEPVWSEMLQRAHWLGCHEESEAVLRQGLFPPQNPQGKRGRRNPG